MKDKVNTFIDRMLEDKSLREEFAADPRGILAREGIDLPDSMIPEKVDAEKLEERLNALQTFTAKFAASSGFQLDKFSIMATPQRFAQKPMRIDPGRIASDSIITTN